LNVPQGSTLGASTSSTGGGSGSGVGAGNNTSSEDLANLQLQSDLERAREQAGQLRGEGESNFQRLLQGIGAFRDRAGEQFQNAGQQITNTASDLLGQGARLGQSARTRAINEGRARGLGDSSRMGLLNQVTGSLVGNQGRTIAQRGENERANQLSYDTRLDEASDRERQAGDYRNTVESQAGGIERAGTAQAGNTFAQMLDNIRNQYQSLSGLVNPQALSQYTPNFQGLNNNLNAATSGLQQMTPGGGNTGANPALNPIDIRKLLGLG
jgi:hypothetical protein